MIWPVVMYAPVAATKPIIAIQPLNFSASGVIVLRFVIGIEFIETLLRLSNAWNYPSEDGIVMDCCKQTNHR